MFAREPMRNRIGSSCLAGLASLAGLACLAPHASAAADSDPQIHSGLSAPVRAWRQALESGDLALLARMHGPQTIGFPPGQTILKGSDAIMKDYRRLFSTYTARVTFDAASWVEQSPLVVSWGLYTLTLHPKAGGPDVVTRGRFTDAATRIGGGWRYIVDHASLPARK